MKERNEIVETVNEYLNVIDSIENHGLKSQIAIKPTQIGLSLGEGLFRTNYAKIVSAAKANDVFVWLDMESYNHLDATISGYESALKKYDNVGMCIQSYLKRSDDDIARIVKNDGIIRLVKGAYKESEKIAYKNRKETTKNYVKLMQYLFAHSDKFMIATHDKNIINMAIRMKRRSKSKVAFGMLNGIMDNYAERLAKSKNEVFMYVPYGHRWMEYAYRRLKESNNIKLIMKSVFTHK